MEYELIIICTQAYRVYVEADDDETAQKLAEQKFEDGEAEQLRDDVTITIDNVYE